MEKYAYSILRTENFKIFVQNSGSNLLLLRKDSNTYIAGVHRRGPQSLAKGFDTVSSGVFEIVTTPKSDLSPKNKVIQEIYEELFNKLEIEIERETQNPDPFFFYKEDIIKDLIDCLNDGRAIFEITGFCIDLIRIVPEITAVLVVRDQGYYNTYKSRFSLNEEYHALSEWQIPSKIENVNNFLTYEIVRDPDSQPPSYGFDPMLWTLPGAFCFCQGLTRAVERQLL